MKEAPKTVRDPIVYVEVETDLSESLHSHLGPVKGFTGLTRRDNVTYATFSDAPDEKSKKDLQRLIKNFQGEPT